MNPLKFLIDDIKKDIQTIKDIKAGKAKLISWKEMDFAGALKTYWPWFILLIAAFCAGLFFGSILAHNHYVELIEEKCPQCFINNESLQEDTKLDLDYYQQWQKSEPLTNALTVKQPLKR